MVTLYVVLQQQCHSAARIKFIFYNNNNNNNNNNNIFLTTNVRRQSVLVGERGSRAAAKSHTLILLPKKHISQPRHDKASDTQLIS